ncbi:hypothetical protein GCM10027341_52680 [Spirosoma knui]
MITLWISASLLALSGWQGYRLGKDYGWWGRRTVTDQLKVNSNQPTTEEPTATGIGQSKTDFDRLLVGFRPKESQSTETKETVEDTEPDNQPLTEPATTLMQITEVDYPDETDLVPETCNWLDDEAIILIDSEENSAMSTEPVTALTDYVKRVRTVQRKMTQLTKRRAADSTFMKQELNILIDTYQLENDQSLDWLFQQHKQPGQPDYGAIFDQIESLSA